MTRTLTACACLLALVACRGGDDSGDSLTVEDDCGDVDGPGTDTGNVPSILGNWTSDVGKNMFAEDCGLEGFKAGSDLPFDGAMEFEGSLPDRLYASFDDNEVEDIRFWAVASGKSVALSGQYESRHGMVHVAMGGMPYWNEYTQRTYIDGFAFFGISTDDDDTTIECTARAEWTATKSGA